MRHPCNGDARPACAGATLATVEEGVAGGAGHSARWSLADLVSPVLAVTVLLTIAISVPIATVVSCNAHEVGHALTGTAFGWEVARIVPCAPTGGEVIYRTSTIHGDALESVSGGVAGAFVLVLVYVVALHRGSLPLRVPIAWAFGLGLVVPVGPQVVIAILEGATRESNYGDTISAGAGIWIPVLLISATIGPIVHVWRWRDVFRRRQA